MTKGDLRKKINEAIQEIDSLESCDETISAISSLSEAVDIIDEIESKANDVESAIKEVLGGVY